GERGTSPHPPNPMHFKRSKGPLDGLDVVALDHVADADVLVVGKGHTTLLPRRDFLYLVLEPLQGCQCSFVHHHVVADHANLGTALHLTFGDTAASHLADLRNVEHLENLGVAQEDLAHGGRQQAGHRRFHVIHEIVDDVVV